MLDVSLDVALHHRASIVVLDKSLPSGFGQTWTLSESLLAEVLDSIIISVGQEVVDFDLLGVIFELVH